MAARRLASASLGARLVLILTGVGVAAALAITLLLAALITPSFDALEARAVEIHAERARTALTDYAQEVEAAVRDGNVRPEPGQVVLTRWPGAAGEDRRLRAAILARYGEFDLRRVLGGRRTAGWYAAIDGRIVALGATVLPPSDGSSGPSGHALMARVLTADALSDLLGVTTGVDLSRPGRLTASSRENRGVAVPIPGPDGPAVGTARLQVPREVSTLGRRVLLLAVAGSTLLLLALLIVLRRVVDRLVLEPLGRVERHMQHVRNSGSLTPLDAHLRGDEIGSLGASFDAMLSQLRAARERIEAQSFQLGRSESAVAVMHNVRNALNPVSTILSRGATQASPIDRATLDRALGELARDEVGGARRRKLVAFVAAASAAEAGYRAEQVRELQVGREALAHALEIIGAQQAAAHERPAQEPCDVSEIVARNATIARYSPSASIAFSFPGHMHLVLANRVLLSQVIGNLLGNAVEAIAAAGRGSGSIAVDVCEEGGITEIRIRDDGDGFDPATAETLFRRGFSTRAHKSGGLGLHWCANSMTAMDGSLRLESEGRGRGAVAVLTLGSAGPGLSRAA